MTPIVVKAYSDLRARFSLSAQAWARISAHQANRNWFNSLLTALLISRVRPLFDTNLKYLKNCFVTVRTSGILHIFGQRSGPQNKPAFAYLFKVNRSISPHPICL